MLKARKFNSDKSQEMLDNYHEWFSHLINKSVVILELGVLKGGSLILWSDYFKDGQIVGLDAEPVKIDRKHSRVSIYQGLQDDKDLLKKIAKQNAPGGFDIIIDDASHYGKETKRSFEFLFHNHLKKGGLYIIEDWGTGYWESWLDGKAYKQRVALSKNRFPSHDYGMVGFIKQLVDEVGMDDITAKGFGVGRPRSSQILKMEIHRGQIAIFKK